MRLLYLATIRLPTEKAHGMQIMKTCEALRRAGATVELVIPTRHNRMNDDPFAYYGVQTRFTLTRLPVPDLIKGGRFGFLLSMLIFAEKARWLKHFWHADVIYSRDHLLLLQYVLLGRPLVFEAHAPPTFLAGFVARHAKHVVVISKALKEAYEAAGVPAARITLAPDAVDLATFEIATTREEARTELGLPRDIKIIAYVGHLYERKGVYTLAEAAKQTLGALVVFVGGYIY